MIINGKKIADDIATACIQRIVTFAHPPQLVALCCAPTFATKRFLEIKKARAASIGIPLSTIELSPLSTTEAVIAAVHDAVGKYDGVLVQLPFPVGIDTEAVLGAIPYSHDVDAMGYEASARLELGTTEVLPPVVGAIRAIAERHAIDFRDAKVVVVGAGRLVGKPAAQWLRGKGAHVTTLTNEVQNLSEQTRSADVLVLGAGVPGLIEPDMVADGVSIFDAGTSEEAGKLVGDADPQCALKASLFTPVPGGIGPITVSIIFQNLLALYAERQRADKSVS